MRVFLNVVVCCLDCLYLEGGILRIFGWGCGVLEIFMYFILECVIFKFLFCGYCCRFEIKFDINFCLLIFWFV